MIPSTVIEKLQILSEILGVQMQDYSLLSRALTHRSYLNERPDDFLEDNERLEYLGDAVLNLIVAELLYHRLPEMKEGRLTRLRAAVVMSAEKRDYQFTLRDEQKYFLGENRDWIVAGGVGYQWFWESFNIGIGIVGTNQSGLELKSRSGEIYRDKIDQSIGFDFTIGGKF